MGGAPQLSHGGPRLEISAKLSAPADQLRMAARTTTLPIMPHQWHDHGMARTRISTTVDADLLSTARKTREGIADSELIDDALAALLAQHRSVEIDEAYATAYAAQPLDEHDEWGDLDSFRTAAGAT